MMMWQGNEFNGGKKLKKNVISIYFLLRVPNIILYYSTPVDSKKKNVAYFWILKLKVTNNFLSLLCHDRKKAKL